MQVTPLPGWLIAQPCKIKEKKTSSGIILSNTAAESIRFVVGVVTACSGQRLIGDKIVDSQVKTGDFVYFDEPSTRDFKFNNIKYFAVEESRIYGVVQFTPEELAMLELPQ